MRPQIYISIILILFQISIVSGQDFAPIGAEWYYSSSAGGAAPIASEYYHLVVVKDTIIHDYNLRKIEQTYFRYQGDSIKVAPYLIYQSGDTIYLYNPDLNKLYRLFIFNATQGDTLTLDIPYDNFYLEDTTYRVVIDTIITEPYDEVELDKYVLEQIDDFGWFSGFYLEKVGGYEWFLPLGKVIIPEADGPIRCYHDSEIDINFTSKDCDYRIINFIDNPLVNRFELFPNPTTNRIEINSDLNIDYIEVYNNTGKFILRTTRLVINLEKFKKGVYLIKVHSDKYNIIEKVIKY